LIPLVTVCISVVLLSTGDTGSMQHETVCEVNGRFFLEINDHLEEIDDITSYCLGCHDGKVGPARQAQVVTDPVLAGGCEGVPRYHPVGATYPDGDPEFASPTMLASGMHIVEGRVTCVTCHDCEAYDHELLVNNRYSALCLTCHRK
jgi:predicted CXXCH cytochrome family protein